MHSKQHIHQTVTSSLIRLNYTSSISILAYNHHYHHHNNISTLNRIKIYNRDVITKHRLTILVLKFITLSVITIVISYQIFSWFKPACSLRDVFASIFDIFTNIKLNRVFKLNKNSNPLKFGSLDSLDNELIKVDNRKRSKNHSNEEFKFLLVLSDTDDHLNYEQLKSDSIMYNQTHFDENELIKQANIFYEKEFLDFYTRVESADEAKELELSSKEINDELGSINILKIKSVEFNQSFIENLLSKTCNIESKKKKKILQSYEKKHKRINNYKKFKKKVIIKKIRNALSRLS